MKNKMVSVLLVAAMVVSMVGCGSSTAGEGSSTSDTAASTEAAGTDSSTSGDKTVITMTWRDEGVGEQSPLYQWFQDAYEAYPDKDKIELDCQYITASEGDYFAKVALALQSKDTAPDIVCEDTFYLPSDVAAGNLTNLDDYVADWDDWNNGSFYIYRRKDAGIRSALSVLWTKWNGSIWSACRILRIVRAAVHYSLCIVPELYVKGI